MTLPWDLLSLDARLSLSKVIETGEPFAKFVAAGGSLALGIVPTNVDPETSEARREDLSAVVDRLVASVPPQLESAAPGLLARSLLTPACGLALRTVQDAEAIVDRLRKAQRDLRRRG